MITLALASTGKHIKKTLTEGEVEAVIDELNDVGWHVHAALGGGVVMYQRQPTIQQPPQLQPPPQQQQQQGHNTFMTSLCLHCSGWTLSMTQ